MSEFKEVGLCRYEWTAYRNVSLSYSFTVPPGVPMELGMLTYNQLIARLERETLAVNGSQQQFANFMTTLNSYLAFTGKTHESPVGPELGRQFDEACRRYCESLGLSERTIRDRRSHLNRWRKTADSLRAEGSSQRIAYAKQSTDFNELLRSAVARTGMSTKALAREAAMSFSTLGRWLRGAVPNTRARPAIARIERLCGLARGQLGQALARADKLSGRTRTVSAPIAYRQELATRVRATYFLNERDFSTALLAELRELYTHKTAKRPVLARAGRGVWAVQPAMQRPDQPVVPFAPTEVCVSYRILTRMLSGYLGYICLDQAEGGLGRSRAEAQTLAWFAVPEAIEGFMRFLEQRSGNLVHGGHSRVARQVITLVQPSTGFLTLQPEYAKQLPVDCRPNDWRAMCADAKACASEWLKASKDKSRNPADPISELLALEDPLKPVIKAVRELDKLAMAAPEGSREEAGCKRDALLLSMLIVNPLRIRNYVLFSIRNSRAGYIYPAGSQYRISIPKSGFKNSKSAGVQDYDVGLPAFLAPRIEDYLENHRPNLIGGKPDSGVLFPSRTTGGVYPDLGRHIESITQRLIPGCPGIGPQAFRHLVATSWLKKNPGDFLTVAELLNDRLETVMKNYAHLRKDDSLSRHGSQVETLFTDDDDED